MRNTEAIQEFPRYIRNALLLRHFKGLLNLSTKQVFGVMAIALGVAAAQDPSIQEIAWYTAGASGIVALFSEQPVAPNVGPLAVFYQEAFRILRDG
jgi:hypothetical protein